MIVGKRAELLMVLLNLIQYYFRMVLHLLSIMFIQENLNLDFIQVLNYNSVSIQDIP